MLLLLLIPSLNMQVAVAEDKEELIPKTNATVKLGIATRHATEIIDLFKSQFVKICTVFRIHKKMSTLDIMNMFQLYLSFNTFSQRRESVKALLESNLWISCQAALHSTV